MKCQKPFKGFQIAKFANIKRSNEGKCKNLQDLRSKPLPLWKRRPRRDGASQTGKSGNALNGFGLVPLSVLFLSKNLFLFLFLRNRACFFA
jgi:hypothetical protein